MQVLSTRQRLTFVATAPDPERPNLGGGQFELAPHPHLQEAPDWIRETNTFQKAVQANLLIEVIAAPQRPAPPVTVEDTDKSAVEDKAASDAGKRSTAKQKPVAA